MKQNSMERVLRVPSLESVVAAVSSSAFQIALLRGSGGHSIKLDPWTLAEHAGGSSAGVDYQFYRKCTFREKLELPGPLRALFKLKDPLVTLHQWSPPRPGRL